MPHDSVPSNWIEKVVSIKSVRFRSKGFPFRDRLPELYKTKCLSLPATGTNFGGVAGLAFTTCLSETSLGDVSLARAPMRSL